MRKKRIAFLVNQFSEVTSGPGRFCEYLRQMHFQELEIIFISHQIKEETHNYKPVHVPKWVGRMPLAWLFRSYFYAKSLQKLHAAQAFDAILSIDYSLAIFVSAGWCRKSLFVMVNDDNYLKIFQPGDHLKGMSFNRRMARTLSYFFERFVVKKSAYVVSNSLYTKGLVEKIYQVPAEQSLLLYKAVDLSDFVPKELESKPPRTFLFVKNDWRRGGLDMILQALSRLSYQSEVHLNVLGISKNEIEEVEDLFKLSGFTGTWRIFGLQNRAQLKNHLQQSDLFISMSRQEALGVSCLEAMASGVPVVASDAGGLKEVLDFGKAGFMVPTERTDLLIPLLEELNLNPFRLKEQAQAALQHVQKFSFQRMQANLEKFFSPKNQV